MYSATTERATGAVVFDFDGTLTDPWPAAEAFERAFLEALSSQSAVALASLRERWSALVTEPDDFFVDGVAMAAGRADPWLRASVVGRAALRALRVDEASCDAAVREAFQRSYTAAPAAFRPNVAERITQLRARGASIFVVTNSPGDRVSARLEELGPHVSSSVTVLGNAQKFSPAAASHPMAQRWQKTLEKTKRFDGAPRDTALLRGRYMDALATACERAGVGIDALTVCGDVFELDLATALTLGASVHFVTHAGAAPWERAAIASHPRASASDDVLSAP